MLRQNINLLGSLTSSSEKYHLSIKNFFILNIIFNIFMILIVLSVLFDLYHTNKNISRLDQNVAYYNNVLLTMKNKFPPAFFNKQSNAISEVHNEVMIGNKMLRSLTQPIFFSDILLILSKDITESVWITKILIEKHGNNITLNGNSYDVVHLEKFISALSLENKFANYKLNITRIGRLHEKNVGEKIEFEIKLTERSQDEARR